MSPENKRRLILYPVVLLVLAGLVYGGFFYKAEPEAGMLLNSAEALYKVGDFDGAIRNAQRALKQEPDNRLAHIILGDSCSMKARHEEAVKHYLRAVALTPVEKKDRGLLRLHLAEAYLASGRNEEGETEALGVARDAPDDFKAWYIVGRAREALGRTQDARLAYMTVREKAPDDPVPCMLLSILEEGAGDSKAAVAWMEKAGTAAPESAEVAVRTARLLLQADRREEAVASLQRIPEAKNRLARKLLAGEPCFSDLEEDPRLDGLFHGPLKN